MNIFRFPVAATLDAVGRFIKAGDGADKVMSIGTDVINKVSADSLRKFMDGLSSALNRLSPNVLLHSLGQVTRTVLSAIVKKVGQLNVVRDGVMSNKLNELTISFLWTQRHELVNFIVDIVECAKCYVKSTSLDGQRDLLEEHGTDNELDISMPMNQHALLCVYNRGDGILWDLIECAGQRTRYGYRCAESQKCIVQTTASSRAAQIALVNQLEDALVKADDGATYKYVVMVAHSQGCLVLRLALEQLLKSGSESVQKVMRERLCVFTFGNPSVEWKIGSAQVLHTEHFANEKDFVAKLGVMYDDKQKERGFTNVFVNKEKEWTGHLFGTQYSLKPQHYTDGFQVKGSNRSWLLNCLEGESIDVARKR
ncbi:hypothetical protein BKCO1_37000155 [Neofusicoccum parvum]|uniref:Uncharacterized protein n=1 Tax=Neofusicoccum parvum TaxID=310453 RepID=A0ACB5SFA0_9PEZI|nr:hypothetical protein BKCO1_37000155 [Neofusicoccum parvum]